MSVNVNDPKSVIVIGGGVAGMNVIGKLLGRKPSFDITCITKEPRYDYSTCGLPFVLEGKIEKFEDIILHKPEFFSENNVRVMNNTEVTKLDLSNQTIEIHDQEGTQDLHYDYLVKFHLSCQTSWPCPYYCQFSDIWRASPQPLSRPTDLPEPRSLCLFA